MRVKVLAFSVAVLALAGNLCGQSVKHHPGDTLKFAVKFDGDDADKIKTVGLLLQTRTPAPASQIGFSNNSGGGTCVKAFPGSVKTSTFNCEITIRPNVIDGDYFLVVSAEADPGGMGYTSDQGKDFQLPLIPIENDKKFSPPKVIVTEKP